MPPILTPTEERGALEMLRQAKERFKIERSLPPSPLPLVPAAELIARSNYQRAEVLKMERVNVTGAGRAIKQTFCGEEKTVSRAELNDLKSISLREMQVRQVHRGRYLLVRIASPTVRMTSLSWPVIDVNGDASLLALYNYPLYPLSLKTPALADVDELFSVGTILLIKEPWVKQALSGSQIVVRVDSSTDLKVVKKGDPILEGVKWKETGGRGIWKVPEQPKRTLDEWKAKGNKHLASRLYLSAEKSYTLGIEQHPSHPDLHLLFLNRAAVNLTLERFNAALADSTKALSLLLLNTSLPLDKLNTFKSKARHRRTSSLYSLRRWSDAKDAFVEFLAAHPDSVEASAGLARTEDRLREAATGDYNLVALFRKAQQDPSSRMDVADFVGPVEVVSLEGRGRGIVTTRDVKAGELLLATKAIKMATPEDRVIISLGINLLTERIDSPEHVNLRYSLAYHLAFQPELLPLVSNLYAGPTFPTPSNSYDLHLSPSLEPGSPSSPVDASLIDRVSSFNSFGARNLSRTNQDSLEEPETSTGLFCNNSLLNHSCKPNADWICLNDFQLIRAVVDIPSGTEVTITYIGSRSFDERQEMLKHYLAGSSVASCSCDLCSSDKEDGRKSLDRRQAILTRRPPKQSPFVESHGAASVRKEIKAVERDIEELLSTYSPDRGRFKPEMAPIYQTLGYLRGLLAQILRDSSAYASIVKEYLHVLESVGVIVVDKSLGSSSSSSNRTSTSDATSLPVSSAPRAELEYAVSSVIQLAIIHKNLGKDEVLGKRWLTAGMWMDNLWLGGGWELFKERHREPMEMWGLMELAG